MQYDYHIIMIIAYKSSNRISNKRFHSKTLSLNTRILEYLNPLLSSMVNKSQVDKKALDFSIELRAERKSADLFDIYMICPLGKLLLHISRFSRCL